MNDVSGDHHKGPLMTNPLRNIAGILSLLFILFVIGLLGYYGPLNICSDLLRAAGDSHFEITWRSDKGRVKADMRSTANALEAYYVDHGAYPIALPLVSMAGDPELARRMGGESLGAIFPGSPDGPYGLTTPQACMTNIFTDRFTAGYRPRIYYRGRYFTKSLGIPENPFVYFRDDNGWILVSPGPDLDYDIDPKHDYKSGIPQPSHRLLVKSYDPSNGTISDGDVFRVKQ